MRKSMHHRLLYYFMFFAAGFPFCAYSSGKSSPASNDKSFKEFVPDGDLTDKWLLESDSKVDRYNIPAELFSTALDLMYRGYEELGWKFIRDAWPDKIPMDKELMADFRERMSSSPYWPELQKAYQEMRQKSTQKTSGNTLSKETKK
jgi:hypothetical protein